MPSVAEPEVQISRAPLTAPDAATPAEALQSQIDTIERVFRDLPQAEISTEHWIAGGLYCRRITIPRGVFAVGALHLKDHVSVMVSGRMRVLTEAGMEELAGHHVWTPKPGLRRVGFAYEDTVWLTVHRTDAATVEAAEDELFANPDGLLSRRTQRIERDRTDYLQMLADVGIDHDTARSQTENTDDQRDFPPGYAWLQVRGSDLDGCGLFTARDLAAGTTIPARIDGQRTPAGRFTNHSATPNVAPMLRADGIDFITLRPIAAGEEITVDYRAAVQCARIAGGAQ
jgi:hypothetical protein